MLQKQAKIKNLLILLKNFDHIIFVHSYIRLKEAHKSTLANYFSISYAFF